MALRNSLPRMALVPRYHPLHGRPNKTLLAECVPNSPRDAWTWLANNPRLAARSGLPTCLASSPGQSCHVLYITGPQYSQIKDETRLCVLCSWDPNFQGWQPSQHVVLENDLDRRLHFRLSGIRELGTEQEVVDAQRQAEADGLTLLSEEVSDRAPACSTNLDNQHETPPSTQAVAIPIPPRGHMRRRSMVVEPNAVLFTLTRLNSSDTERGLY